MTSLLDTAREHRVATSAVIGIGILVIAVLGYLFQPWQLFLDTQVDEAFPVSVEAADPAPDIEPPTDDTTADDVTEEEPDAPAAPAGPVLLVGGEFQDRSHPASGTVGIFELEDGSRVLRIEDLETDNGPDLYVYLSAADADAEAGEFDDEFVSLGRLKGNLGSQNYEIPADVDLSRFASIVIWCDRFDVAFGSAALA